MTTTTSPQENKPSITKKDQVVALLKHEDGATLNDIVVTTGWLPHSARAFLTGLRKMGHVILCTKIKGATRYSIKTDTKA